MLKKLNKLNKKAQLCIKILAGILAVIVIAFSYYFVRYNLLVVGSVDHEKIFNTYQAEGGKIYYSDFAGTISISTMDRSVTAIDIPATINGKPVTGLWLESANGSIANSSKLKRITGGENITDVGFYAKNGLYDDLSEISLDNATYKLYGIIQNLPSLNSFTSPTTVTHSNLLSDNINNLTVSSGTTKFYLENYSKIATITLPKSLESFTYSGTVQDPGALKQINYQGTESEWYAMKPEIDANLNIRIEFNVQSQNDWKLQAITSTGKLINTNDSISIGDMLVLGTTDTEQSSYVYMCSNTDILQINGSSAIAIGKGEVTITAIKTSVNISTAETSTLTIIID